MSRNTILCLSVVALGGCAAVQFPPGVLERSEASIRGAEEVGAESVPAARLHLQMARDQTVLAKRLAANGDERATLVLARAEADSELALNMAREATIHAQAVRAAEDLKALQSRGTP